MILDVKFFHSFLFFYFFPLLFLGPQTEPKCLQCTVSYHNSLRKLMVVLGKFTLSDVFIIVIIIVFKFAFLRLTIMLPSIAGTRISDYLRRKIFLRRQTLRLYQIPRHIFPVWRIRLADKIRWRIFLRRRTRRRSQICINPRSNRRKTIVRPNRRRHTS